MECRVVIADELYAGLTWERDGLAAACVVNQALVNFEPKVGFARHLSIIVDAVDLSQQGMPTPGESVVLDRLGDELDRRIKAPGNAPFLARVTWDGTRRLVYRVHNPDIANDDLARMIRSRSREREWEFQMEHDEAWEFARHYPAPGRAKP